MMLTVALAITLGYATVVALLYFFQRSLMYRPGGDPGLPSDAGVPEMTELMSQARDGVEIVSWIVKPLEPARRTIVLFHGNAGNIADRGFKARHFIDAGYGVVLAGYRGFGNSPGAPSEQGLYADAMGLVEKLGNLGLAPGDMILYGESLGSGVAVHLAKSTAKSGGPVGGLILEAPFTSMADAAAFHYSWLPAHWLVKDRYDSRTKISDIGTPLLIIHGDHDKTVPQAFGKTLFSAAQTPKEAIWVDGAGHVDLYNFEIVEPILAWLNRIGSGKAL